MFDNLRDSSYYEEGEQSDLSTEPEVQAQPAPAAVKRRRRNPRFLGMTAQQRFLLAVMLLVTVCVMGTLAMYITGRMGFF